MQSLVMHKPEGDPVFEFIQKKRSEGKCRKEAMVRGISHFPLSNISCNTIV